MSARKLPDIAPCPCGELRCGLIERTRADTGKLVGYFVHSECGWIGPIRKTKAAAILAWNRRADAEAERRGAMAAADWMERQGFPAWAGQAREAIERGEVIPAREAKPERPKAKQKRGGK